MSCDAACDENCINSGINQLTQFIIAVINGSQPVSGPIIVQRLTDAFQTFKCKLPPDIKNQITKIIEQISVESSNVVVNVNILYLTVIFIILFLLIIFNYATIYLQSNTATLIFLLLSLFIILIGALIIYAGVNRIYNNANNNITILVDNLQKLLTSIECAGQSGFCCLASFLPQSTCAKCITC